MRDFFAEKSFIGVFIAPILLVNVLLLSACATRSTSGIEVGADDSLNIQELARVTSLQQLQDWQFKGRISIRIETAGAADGGSGSLNWVQSQQSMALDFHAALGRGAWQLRAGSDRAEVTLADGSKYRDADVQALLHQQLGWDVPVNSLSCWLRGLVIAPECPENSATVQLRDSNGRPLQIREDEWLVLIHSWSEVNNLSLPKKIEFSAPGRRFKLVISQWTLP